MTDADGWSRRAILAASAAALAGCGTAPRAPASSDTTPGSGGYDLSVSHDLGDWAGYDPEWAAPTDSPLAGERTPSVLVENLEIPWDLSFAPNGELFISERTGRVLRFEAGEVSPVVEPADVIDAGSIEPGTRERSWWVEGGEGGLLGVAAHPGYPDPPVVYVYYTRQEGENREDRVNRVAAFDVSAADPGADPMVLVDGIPGSIIHNGGRITFGPENYLWITTGDGGEGANSQDTTSLGGKVLRVTPAGEPAPDNPDLGADADPRIFSYGHRNPQGIAWLPDATPVVTEHGPGGHDEVNVLRRGANYGWPEARRREAYAGTDYQRPVANTGNRTWAPTGCCFYTGDAVPEWRNRLLVGALHGQHVNVLTISEPGADLPPLEGESRRFDADWLDDRFVATSHRTFVNELGRVRHVEQGPDGALYMITSNRDGRAEGPFPRERDDVLVRIDA